jgi:3-oxoacyl-[acyl-carrier protein] reductase
MRILMTGCSSGFGKTVRENLQRQGHDVFGVGLDGPDLKMDLESVGKVPAHADSIAEDIVKAAGPRTVLICNAGTTHINFLQNHDTADFIRILNVNLVSAFALTRSFWYFNRNEAGRHLKVIYTSSMASKFGMRASPGYCASKAGLEGMMRSLSRECAGKGVTFLGIAPGTVEDTKISAHVIDRLVETRGMSREEALAYSLQSPLKRAATHDEVWKVFDFAVNHAPEFMTGETIYMPAGMGI